MNILFVARNEKDYLRKIRDLLYVDDLSSMSCPLMGGIWKKEEEEEMDTFFEFCDNKRDIRSFSPEENKRIDAGALIYSALKNSDEIRRREDARSIREGLPLGHLLRAFHLLREYPNQEAEETESALITVDKGQIQFPCLVVGSAYADRDHRGPFSHIHVQHISLMKLLRLFTHLFLGLSTSPHGKSLL